MPRVWQGKHFNLLVLGLSKYLVLFKLQQILSEIKIENALIKKLKQHMFSFFYKIVIWLATKTERKGQSLHRIRPPRIETEEDC
jgi:hypothetical protein